MRVITVRLERLLGETTLVSARYEVNISTMI